MLILSNQGNRRGYGLPKQSVDRIRYKIGMANELQKEWPSIPPKEQALAVADLYGYTLDVAEELGCYEHMTTGATTVSVTVDSGKTPAKILNDDDMCGAMEALRKCEEMAPRIVLANENQMSSKTALAFYMRELDKVAQYVF